MCVPLFRCVCVCVSFHVSVDVEKVCVCRHVAVEVGEVCVPHCFTVCVCVCVCVCACVCVECIQVLSSFVNDCYFFISTK